MAPARAHQSEFQRDAARRRQDERERVYRAALDRQQAVTTHASEGAKRWLEDFDRRHGTK